MTTAIASPEMTTAGRFRPLPVPAPPARCPGSGLVGVQGGRGTRHDGRDDSSDAANLELFRLAVCERDDDACRRIVARYGHLVFAWICRHPAWTLLQGECGGEEKEYWIARTFARFWQALNAERFRGFGNLPSLLGYLKLCAASVVLDETRRRSSAVRIVSREQLLERGGPGFDVPDAAEDVEARVLAAEERSALWAAVARALPDGPQRLAIGLRFGWGMPAREIQRRCPGVFGDVEDVYRATRNGLQRLRRNSQIRLFREATLTGGRSPR
jgi:DNA-directed RNA polymerase specialized sigma24 family protein